MNRLSKLLYVVCILSVISVMTVFFCHEKPFEFNTSQEQSYCMIDDYNYSSIDDASAPIGITQIYSWTLQNVPRTNGMILFYFSHQEVEVTIDNTLVYSLGVNKDNYFSKGVGFGVSKIPVYPEDEGKTIRIKVRPVYQSSIGKKLSIYFGDYNKIALDIFNADVPIILICSLCLLIGFVMLFYSFYKYIRKKANLETICISIFAIFTGLWKFTDIKTAAFFMPNPLLMSTLSILSIPIMVTSFVFYLRYQFSMSQRRVWTVTGVLCSILTLVILLLQITRVADIKQTLIISHFMITLVIIQGITGVIKEFRAGIASHKLKAIFVCVLLCMIGTILDIVIFYYTKHSSGTFLGIMAFFIYIVYMGLLSLHEAITLIRQGRSARHYEELAMHDELTGLYSRVFFKQYVAKHPKPPVSCCLIMFDVNNLKQCNDTQGHSCGDMLLRNSANFIKEAFLPDGLCIRLSGDEFCVVLEGKDEAFVKNALYSFANSTKEFNENHPDSFPIRVAYGFACFDHSLDLDLDDTLKRADKKMYEMKHQMKQEAAHIKTLL